MEVARDEHPAAGGIDAGEIEVDRAGASGGAGKAQGDEIVLAALGCYAERSAGVFERRLGGERAGKRQAER